MSYDVLFCTKHVLSMRPKLLDGFAKEVGDYLWH